MRCAVVDGLRSFADGESMNSIAEVQEHERPTVEQLNGEEILESMSAAAIDLFISKAFFLRYVYSMLTCFNRQSTAAHL